MMTEQQLRDKCELLAPAGCAVSATVLVLIRDRDRLRVIIDGLTERVAKQSELLARRAERESQPA